MGGGAEGEAVGQRKTELARGRPPNPGQGRYNTFLLLLGMVRTMQVDSVWDHNGLP